MSQEPGKRHSKLTLIASRMVSDEGALGRGAGVLAKQKLWSSSFAFLPGPMSVGLDFSLPGMEHVYGIDPRGGSGDCSPGGPGEQQHQTGHWA